MEKKTSGYKEELLVSSSDVVELGYITDMLSEMGISYRVEEKAEQFVSMFYGKSAPLVNIYVDERRLSEAKEILKPSESGQAAFGHEADSLREEEYDPQQEVLYKYRRAFLYSLLTPVGIIIAIGILIVSISFIYLIVRLILA